MQGQRSSVCLDTAIIVIIHYTCSSPMRTHAYTHIVCVCVCVCVRASVSVCVYVCALEPVYYL